MKLTQNKIKKVFKKNTFIYMYVYIDIYIFDKLILPKIENKLIMYIKYD